MYLMSDTVNLDQKPQVTPPEHFQKWLEENNYVATLSIPRVRAVDGGGVLVEQPQLIIDFKPKETSIK